MFQILFHTDIGIYSLLALGATIMVLAVVTVLAIKAMKEDQGLKQ